MEQLFKEITNLYELGPLLKDLQVVDKVSLDTETSSLNPFTKPLLLFQIRANGHTYLIDARKHTNIITYLVQLLKDSKKLCLFHNSNFDLKMIFTSTGEMLENVYDTMLGEILLYQGLGYNFPSLKSLVEKYCGVTLEKDVRETFVDFEGEFTQEQLIYSSLDVQYLEEIRENQLELLAEQKQLRVIDLENKLAPVIATMELNGITLDEEAWLKLSKASEGSALEWEDKIKTYILDRLDYSRYNNLYELLTGLGIDLPTNKLLKSKMEVNPNIKRKEELFKSITDLSACRFFVKDLLDIGSPKIMKIVLQLFGANVADTNAKTLQKIKGNELIDMLLKYRENDKAVSSFGEDYFKYINPITGRIHTSYHQLGTSTGRLSSSTPNLQQVPREQEYRRCFIARKGYKLIAADFSQQEYRLAGAIFNEPVIVKAYKDGKDMHTATACILYNKSETEIQKSERSRAKSINFAVLYGTTGYGLAYNLQVPLEEAEALLDKFYRGYPVLTYSKKLVEEKIMKNYYSVTMMGRRRYWERKKIFADSKEMYKYQKRIARKGFNHIIQGTGADVTKQSLINLYYNNPFGSDFKVLLQVHDEIVCEVREDLVDKGVSFVVNSMKEAFQPFLGEIPAEVSVDVNDYWVH